MKTIAMCGGEATIPLADLKPMEKNPRKLNQAGFDYLVKSIEARGVYKPLLVWEKNNEVIGGNQRLMVMKTMVERGEWGITEVPIVYFRGTKKEARLVATDDNNNAGEWDYDLLPSFLKDMTTEMDFSIDDLNLTGFTQPELDFIGNLDKSVTDFRKDLDKEPELASAKTDGLKTVQLKIPTAQVPEWESAVVEAKANGARTAWEVIKYLIERKA